MRNSLTRRFLGFLLIVSLLIVILHGFNLFESPADRRAQRLASGTTAAGVVNPSGNDQPPETTQPLKDLEISGLDSSKLASDGVDLRLWPQESTLPQIYTVLPGSFQGRPVGDTALAGITVYLDAAHGGQDPGDSLAPVESEPNLMEKDITRAVAEKTRDNLEAMGARVVMLRERDESLSVYARIGKLNIDLLDRFAAEMAKQGLASEKIASLRHLMGDLVRINNDQRASGGQGVFAGIGTAPDVRVLFDLQRQFSDSVLISLHAENEAAQPDRQGFNVLTQNNQQVFAYHNQQADGRNVFTTPPVYSAFDDAGRERFAGLLNHSLTQTAPALAPESTTVRSNKQVNLLRDVNLVSAIVSLGNAGLEADSRNLRHADLQNDLARGITDAIYHYYTQ